MHRRISRLFASRKKNDFMEYYRQQNTNNYADVKGYLYSIAGLFGLVLYLYGNLLMKKEDMKDLTETDYENLTARQIKKREEHLRISRDFNKVLDKLQVKLNDEYQEQLEEFQQYAKKKEELKSKKT